MLKTTLGGLPVVVPARALALALALILTTGLAGCSEPAAPEERAVPASATPASPVAQAAGASGRRVLAISVDGLNVRAIRRLGSAGTPALHRMLRWGAGTLNARTATEQTNTLPNHTSMVTSRRIDASRGGHGVTWNDDRPGRTVQEAAGEDVRSVFSAVHSTGGSTALYTTKSKLSLFDRSWPSGVGKLRVKQNQKRLVALARADLRDGAPRFTFLHVSLPDRNGHQYGGMSPEYLSAVRRTDAQLAKVLRVAARKKVTVILTSDHGFATGRTTHSDRTDAENYTVAFLAWGRGVDRARLYAINPGFRNPGKGSPSYGPRRQPVRNGDVANLAASLLGVGPLRGSEFAAGPVLQVRR